MTKRVSSIHNDRLRDPKVLMPSTSMKGIVPSSHFFRCLKEKEKLQGMLRIDSGQLGNVKGELLKLTKEETADCQLWHNVSRTEEQNNSRLTVIVQRGQKRRAEETEE
ncbi:hypothetical protein AVEN_251664-1 [Araneus ventricosus]|uniref:Uncharacterized protein n=1 Tax=Araneus ventricosus TaxID=182803 RepID=A0A4Y2TIW0_ARAVE|nr:hypothetical protein AVEN_251664-1 [Araneus ventricosus]